MSTSPRSFAVIEGLLDTLDADVATGAAPAWVGEWTRRWRARVEAFGFTSTLQVNLLAMANLCREAVAHFRGRGGGILINTSSQVAHRGHSHPAGIQYAASKGAIKAMSQSIARGFAREGVLVYILAPGVTQGKRCAALLQRDDQRTPGLESRWHRPTLYEDRGVALLHAGVGVS